MFTEIVWWSALDWSLWRRRADTEQRFQDNPVLLAASRAVLARVSQRRFQPPGATLTSKQQPAEDEDVRRPIDVGPGVLAPVFDEFDLNTHTWKDRTPYVRVIEALGDVRDTPLLIDTPALIVDGIQSGHTKQNNRRGALAIHRCLEKLTGQSCPETSFEGRAKFWNDWWYENAMGIVLHAAVERGQAGAKSP
jgi:hypothetical protein